MISHGNHNTEAGSALNGAVNEDGNAVLQEELERDSVFAERWRRKANQRAIAMSLIYIRQTAGLTQAQVAEHAGWKQAHVARLESAHGPEPGISTLRRFAEACGEQLAVAFGTSQSSATFRIHCGVRLGDRERNKPRSLKSQDVTYRSDCDITHQGESR